MREKQRVRRVKIFLVINLGKIGFTLQVDMYFKIYIQKYYMRYIYMYCQIYLCKFVLDIYVDMYRYRDIFIVRQVCCQKKLCFRMIFRDIVIKRQVFQRDLYIFILLCDNDIEMFLLDILLEFVIDVGIVRDVLLQKDLYCFRNERFRVCYRKIYRCFKDIYVSF